MKDVQVYDQAGREQGAVALKVSLTKKELAPKAYATAVRVILQNRRQGTVGVKGRSEVSATGKKPWKQKGTGRARAGSASSPLWRKGGVTHGPTPRTRTLKMGRKQRAHVYNNIFFERLDAGRIKCLEFEKEFEKPSTKLAYEALKNLSVANARIVVFLDHEDVLLASSFRNIPNVSVLSFDQPNAYDLTNGAHWVFLKKDMDSFKKMIMQWN